MNKKTMNCQPDITKQLFHKEKSAVFCDFFSLWALILPYTDRGHHLCYTLCIGRAPPLLIYFHGKSQPNIFSKSQRNSLKPQSVIRFCPDFILSLSRLFLISLCCSAPHREQTRNKSQQENERGQEIIFSIMNCTITV